MHKSTQNDASAHRGVEVVEQPSSKRKWCGILIRKTTYGNVDELGKKKMRTEMIVLAKIVHVQPIGYHVC